jgi:2-polyprenyl-3-methyl-5-hydroxy-6-metoxy-1,4-benzoquinol methylase
VKKPIRSNVPEYIDIGPECYTDTEYQDCLKQLGRVGALLGGNRATFAAFSQLAQKPISILDVGCGGGHFTQELAKKFTEAKVVGIDYSSSAIDYAQNQIINNDLPNLSFENTSELKLDVPENSFEVITATLVCHHMSDDNLIDFLKRAHRSASKAIIINDLHRHPLAYGSFALIAPILFRNRLITHDGLLSVQKAFKKTDWAYYLSKAGIPTNSWRIEWKWAFRWIITIHTTSSS